MDGTKHNQVTLELMFLFNLSNFKPILLIPQEHASDKMIN